MEATLVFVVLPLLVANVLHQILVIRHNLLAFLAFSIDGGCTVRGKRIFGEHKRVRGLVVVSVLTSVATATIALFAQFPFAIQPALFGFVLGLAYMLGELPNSFVKRQLGIAPGATVVGLTGAACVVLDHFDSVFATAIALHLLIGIELSTLLLLTLSGGAIHYVSLNILRTLGYHK